MSKLLLVEKRAATEGEDFWNKLTKGLASLFCPENLDKNIPCIAEVSEGKSYLYIFNPVEECIVKEGRNLCIGSLLMPQKGWWQEGRVPNSPLTIIQNEEKLCLYADLLGSRTVWYYFDEHQFVASTSQRAIAVYLQSFEFNQQAAVWMLATGCTGPGFAWDSRVTSLGAGGTLKLNKKSWSLKHTQQKVSFESSGDPESLLKQRLADTIKSTIGKANINFDSTILTLSGGYDSRAALFYLQEKVRHTLSWGLLGSLKDPNTDAAIAQQLAKRFKTEHHFYEADQKELSFDKIFDRFLKAGEGRIDHIQTFTDGMEMWAKTYAEGFRSIVRADEVFGWLPVQNELDARLSVAYNKMGDFSNLQEPEAYDLPEQHFPEFYQRNDEESIEDWRDRLYQQYRITYIQTALHDLVYPYKELVNPLLMDNIVEFTHRLPGNLRTSKRLYREIVEMFVPGIPFATKPSIPEAKNIVKAPDIVQMLKEEISSTEAKNLLSPKLTSRIVGSMKSDLKKATEVEADWKLQFKQMLPFGFKKLLRHSIMRYKADFNELAFRSYLIFQAKRMFDKDSRELK